jgi:hypothetical protein
MTRSERNTNKERGKEPHKSICLNPGSLCFCGCFVVLEWALNRGALNVLGHIVTWPFQAGKKKLFLTRIQLFRKYIDYVKHILNTTGLWNSYPSHSVSCWVAVFCCCSLRTRTTWITLNGMLSYLRRSQHGHLPPNLPFMWMFPTWHLLQSTWPAVAIRNCSLALENKAVNFPITKVRLKWVCVGVCLCVWTNVLSCHFERNIKRERL